MTARLVSAIIPARNAADTVAAAVEALAGGEVVPDEIIVVDDGSTDHTAELARRAGARVVEVPAGGPGPARTAGVAAAKGDVLLFTDADCTADPDFVARLTAPLDDGAAAAKGAYRTTQRSLVARFVQLEFEERYRRLARYESTDFADGHAAAYARADYEAAGGFRSSLRLSQNVDLSYRLSEMGRRIVFVPGARTRHRHPSSVRDYARAKLERSFWRAVSLRQHPGKIVADSYTPWSLKWQMALVAAGALALVAGLVGAASSTAWVALALSAAFVGTCVPFLIHATRLDPPVAAIALPMLFVRATALVVGTVAGAVAGLTGIAGGRIRPDRGGVGTTEGEIDLPGPSAPPLADTAGQHTARGGSGR